MFIVLLLMLSNVIWTVICLLPTEDGSYWTTGVEEHCLQLMPNSDTTHTYEVSLQSSAIAMICNYESSKEYVKYRVEWTRIHLYAIVE